MNLLSTGKAAIEDGMPAGPAGLNPRNSPRGIELRNLIEQVKISVQ